MVGQKGRGFTRHMASLGECALPSTHSMCYTARAAARSVHTHWWPVHWSAFLPAQHFGQGAKLVLFLTSSDTAESLHIKFQRRPCTVWLYSVGVFIHCSLSMYYSWLHADVIVMDFATDILQNSYCRLHAMTSHCCHCRARRCGPTLCITLL